MSSKTIICDIDGCLLHHDGPLYDKLLNQKSSFALQGVLKKLQEWESKGYRVILMTGRKESMRSFTEKQLEQAGVFYDVLIMGMPSPRILINDISPLI